MPDSPETVRVLKSIRLIVALLAIVGVVWLGYEVAPDVRDGYRALLGSVAGNTQAEIGLAIFGLFVVMALGLLGTIGYFAYAPGREQADDAPTHDMDRSV